MSGMLPGQRPAAAVAVPTALLAGIAAPRRTRAPPSTGRSRAARHQPRVGHRRTRLHRAGCGRRPPRPGPASPPARAGRPPPPRPAGASVRRRAGALMAPAPPSSRPRTAARICSAIALDRAGRPPARRTAGVGAAGTGRAGRCAQRRGTPSGSASIRLASPARARPVLGSTSSRTVRSGSSPSVAHRLSSATLSAPSPRRPSLIGHGRVQVAVGDHHRSPGHRRADQRGGVLGAGGREEQRLRAWAHPRAAGPRAGPRGRPRPGGCHPARG